MVDLPFQACAQTVLTMEPRAGKTEDVQSFLPPQTGTDLFTTRRHDVFAGLGELEKKHSAFLQEAAKDGKMEVQGLLKDDPDEEEGAERKKTARDSSRPHHRKSRSALSDTRDSDYRPADRKRSGHGDQQDFSFRRPYQRGGYRRHQRTLPDFKKHPEKYTCYSLGDICDREMSERSNSQAAFAFLEERRLQREREKREMAGLPAEEEKFDAGSAACSQGVIAFSRPQRKKEVSEQGDAEKSTKLSSTASLGTHDEAGEDGTTKEEEVNSSVEETNNPEPVSSFKSRKKSNVKRNIRQKHDDDSD